MIKLNLRWLVQAVALLLSIAGFTRLFDSSKTLLRDFSWEKFVPFLLWALLFLCGFFLLLFTSYLKQRGNFTLRNRIAPFEKMIRLLHLDRYQERDGVSDARQRKQAQERAS